MIVENEFSKRTICKHGIYSNRICEICAEVKPLEHRLSEMVAALKQLYQPHLSCEDIWYSCPKSEEGCADDRQDECNCGADYYNSIITKALNE